MKFLDAGMAWLEYRQRMVDLELIAHSTWNNQCQITGALSKELGAIDLAEIRKSHIELYIGKRLRTHEPVTIAGEIAVLRQILNWCVDEQHLVARPRLPTVSVPNVEFMLLTGLSPHEVERIEHRDVRMRIAADNVDCPLEVQIGFREGFQTKTAARKRVVVLNKRASSIILGQTMGTHQTHQPFPSRDSTEKAIQRMRKRFPDAPAGVERITPKMMRQWFASKISGDIAENVLQALLGHAPGSKVTRRHYVRSNEAQRVDAVSSLKLP
jgi:integrase